MLKINILIYFIYIICADSVAEDKELLIIEKNDNVLEQQNLNLNYLEHENYFDRNKYQKIKNKNKNKNIYFFKESYKDATKCIDLFFKKFINFNKNNSSIFTIEIFINFLFKNLNIDINDLKFLDYFLTYDYLEIYFSLFKNLFQCSINKNVFNDILDINNIENNIDLCFNKLTKFFIKFPKKKIPKYYFEELISLKLFFNKNLKNLKKSNNISEMIQNNIVLYLFSPYFFSYYIFYNFVEIYLNDILIFFKKNLNKSLNKSKYTFNVEKLEKYEYFFTLKNKSKKIIITLSIEKIKNEEVNQTGNCFSLIDLKVIYNDNKFFNNPALLTKDNLKLMFTKDSELLNSFNTENMKNTIN